MQPRRCDQGRRPADLARERQGDHGRPGVRGRHRERASGQDRRQGQRGHPDPAAEGRRRCLAQAPPAGAPVVAQQDGAAGPGPPQPRQQPAPAAGPAAPAATSRLLRVSMPARPCAAWPASSRSTSTKLKGTGEKGRITKEDVQAFLKGPGAGPGGGSGPRGRHGHPRDPGPGLLEVRPGREEAAGPDQADLRPASCTAPGSTSRTSPTATRPTSPRSSLPQGARRRRPRPTRSPYRVSLLPFLMKASVSALQGVPGVQQLAESRRRTR